jgi:hypothetical protein
MTNYTDERLAHAASLALAPTAIQIWDNKDDEGGEDWTRWQDAIRDFRYWEGRIGSWSELLGESAIFTDLIPEDDRYEDGYHALLEAYTIHALNLFFIAGERAIRSLADQPA